MAWHPTLDNLESRPDRPWDRPRPVTGAQHRARTLVTIGVLRECWCGLPVNPDWEGKADRAPHPRERARA
jgi:hypothetical protein